MKWVFIYYFVVAVTRYNLNLYQGHRDYFDFGTGNMNKTVLIGAAISFVIVLLFIVLMPKRNVDQDLVTENTVSATPPVNLGQSKVEPEERFESSKEMLVEDKHRNDMQSAYAGLQQSRKQLKSDANWLKSKIWGLKLPSEQARTINNTMRQTYAYLKNPPMLGAYFSVDEINREVRQVESMIAGLGKAEKIISSRDRTGE